MHHVNAEYLPLHEGLEQVHHGLRLHQVHGLHQLLQTHHEQLLVLARQAYGEWHPQHPHVFIS